MLKTKLLKTRVHYHSTDRSSGVAIHTVACKGYPGEAELESVGLHARYCGCFYDCCGCLNAGHPSVDRRNKRNEWKVTQHWYYCV